MSRRKMSYLPNTTYESGVENFVYRPQRTNSFFFMWQWPNSDLSKAIHNGDNVEHT